MTVYGIPNCDTIKKTQVWLKKNKISFTFHDYKKSGVSKTILEKWCKLVEWDVLVNRKGTTWKKLSPDEQAMITNKAAAIKLMQEYTSLIKRPVIELDNGTIIVGYDEDKFTKQLK